jgi:protein-L-isoaspartate(D-aspartate) O-methyltransferase
MGKLDYLQPRSDMVSHQIVSRGIRNPRVLHAMGEVPREAFLPPTLHEFAYDDTPLPITEGQTISQPYIVAFMIDALDLKGGEKILEIGTGSGYAAAVMAEIAADVYTVERIGPLAEKAAITLQNLGYNNIHILHADGTLGWPDHAPYDAITVAAGGPDVPEALKSQLKVGGKLVIPVGHDQRAQELVCVTRTGPDTYTSTDLADVRFVPLVGEKGWPTEAPTSPKAAAPAKRVSADETVSAIARHAERFGDIATTKLDGLMDRIGDARIVLIGEATHGTSEFYRMRQRISRELIERKGFSFIAIEGDWPDAARIDHYVRHAQYPASEWTAFARFPTWMWRNREVRDFVEWLRTRNHTRDADQRTAFYGLDLYSLNTSIRAVLEYLDRIDPAAAKIARERYGCLTPWQADPATYGHATLTGAYETCEQDVARMLTDLLQKQRAYATHDGDRFLDAVQNAKLIANAEKYYRIMYYGSRASWNLRDTHMFETLTALLNFHGPQSKGIVWAHNSHVGDALATEMSARGEHNIGQLCRSAYGQETYLIGFGTHAGTVAAASDWDGPLEIKAVQPSRRDSYEGLCHATGIRHFMLPLRAAPEDVKTQLETARLQRAIGVIYRPETELMSHYFSTVLTRQFDEYIWFDNTEAVHPLQTAELKGQPDTYPFGV